uniref:Nose resistant-to-fluoxetine protein N-terminal domain-containing protein n=1 Tax=Clastoptera arizonana TaxID=38151 RepID=A0A1B6D6A1_9HEMI
MMISRLVKALLLGWACFTVSAEKSNSSHSSKINARLNQIRDTMIPPSMYQEAMFHLMSYYAPLDATSELCRNHSILYQEAFLNDTLWAAKMFDASSKIGEGVNVGAFVGLGSYEGCLMVDVPGLFKGQHCLVEVTGILDFLFEASHVTKYTLFPGFNLDFAFSMCIPSTCTVQDIRAHMDVALQEINASSIINDNSCSKKEPTNLRLSDWIAIYILVLLIAAIVLSTWYDYFVCHNPSKQNKILTAFSIQANTRKLLHVSKSSDSLSIVYFLRFFAIVWIVAGHRFNVVLAAPSPNLLTIEKYLTVWWNAPILHMTIAVEIFFLLSGLLVSYNFLKSRNCGKEFNLFQYYFHRYLRLTPSLALVILLEASLIYQVSEGPIWKRLIGASTKRCEENWWSSLLYISNYVHPYSMCMVQSWYLSVDMQLYLISPLLLIPLQRNANRGLKIILVCFIATVVASFSNAWFFGLQGGGNVSRNKKVEINHGAEYVLTHVRAASWLIGLALGYFIYEYKQKGRKFIMNQVSYNNNFFFRTRHEQINKYLFLSNSLEVCCKV